MHTLPTTRNITSRLISPGQAEPNHGNPQSEDALSFAAKCKSATSGTRSPIRARPFVLRKGQRFYGEEDPSTSYQRRPVAWDNAAIPATCAQESMQRRQGDGPASEDGASLVW